MPAWVTPAGRTWTLWRCRSRHCRRSAPSRPRRADGDRAVHTESSATPAGALARRVVSIAATAGRRSSPAAAGVRIAAVCDWALTSGPKALRLVLQRRGVAPALRPGRSRPCASATTSRHSRARAARRARPGRAIRAGARRRRGARRRSRRAAGRRGQASSRSGSDATAGRGRLRSGSRARRDVQRRVQGDGHQAAPSVRPMETAAEERCSESRPCTSWRPPRRESLDALQRVGQEGRHAELLAQLVGQAGQLGGAADEREATDRYAGVRRRVVVRASCGSR